MDQYYKRILDEQITQKLKTIGAIYIRGPKWCGKTTTAKRYAKSVVELQKSTAMNDYIALANNAPSVLLKREKPVLIDEWQLAPTIWNAVRTYVDDVNSPGQFILTGSATPIEDATLHSGTGRIGRLTMYPMSLYESLDSNGQISLKDIVNQTAKMDGVVSSLNIEKIAYVLCRGGWPSTMDKDPHFSVLLAKDYVDALCESDVAKTVGVPLNPLLVRTLMRSYSRNVSTMVTDKTILEDVRFHYGDISDTMIRNYIQALEKLYVIDEIPAWNPNLRSKTVIRSSNKKSFVDPSLACAALDISPEKLLLDYQTFGLLFENLCLRDLKIYAGANGGYVRHYRDQYGLECDAVIHFDNGRYGLVEIKLGTQELNKAASNLLKLNQLIQSHQMPKPDFLLIITGSDYAYQRKDGVLVVPIGCLKD